MAKKKDRKTHHGNRMREPKLGEICEACGKHPVNSFFKGRGLCGQCLNIDDPSYEKRVREFLLSRTLSSSLNAEVRRTRARSVAEQITDTVIGEGSLLPGCSSPRPRRLKG